MKLIRTVLCIGMICFLLFTPQSLIERSGESFTDARFVRNEDRYNGSILIYHIVRHRPYEGSLSQWLKDRAAAYEKKHKGTYIEIEGMDETHFYERVENGRLPDAYSFFSGTLDPDRLLSIPEFHTPLREGLFQTDRCVPYGYTGYCRLVKKPETNERKIYSANDILAAWTEAKGEFVPEEKADVLYLDLRRAGDLIRYREGFSLAGIESLGPFTDAVCWMGIDRETDKRKAEVILDFIGFLLTPDVQQGLNAMGMLSVRSDVRNTPPDASLKQVFKSYTSVETVDPFRWRASYDALAEDAALAKGGDEAAYIRFTIRLRECCS